MRKNFISITFVKNDNHYQKKLSKKKKLFYLIKCDNNNYSQKKCANDNCSH